MFSNYLLFCYGTKQSTAKLDPAFQETKTCKVYMAQVQVRSHLQRRIVYKVFVKTDH